MAPISIDDFLQAIRRLPPDEPVDDPKNWYRTQKEHWLGWLSEYRGPGAYGRKIDKTRDARFAYNHIVEPKMLLWLAEAGGVSPRLVNAARSESARATAKQQQSAVVRRYVPWEVVANSLWPPPGPVSARVG